MTRSSPPTASTRARAAMFEDIAKNLVVPKARGMTTVLVTAKPGQTDHRQDLDRDRPPGESWISSPTTWRGFWGA